jgi:hypothetical protein
MVGVGLACALALAIFSQVRVSSEGITYRQAETWSSESVLALNTDLAQFAALVDQYAALATSDEVIASLMGQGLLPPDAAQGGKLPIAATAVPSAVTGAPTPLLRLTAQAESPAAATRLVIGATDTFINVAKSRQEAGTNPENPRVRIEILTRAGGPVLTGPRKKTTAIFILLAGLTIVVAAVFIRDNMKRDDDDQRGVPPYQLEAAPGLDPVLDSRETAEADAPAPDPVFRGHEAARGPDADPADVASVTVPRRSSSSSR